MGYLGSGYAFCAEPDWERVRRLLPSFHVRGYRHKDRPLWMLDAWKSIRGVDEHYPFTGEPIRFEDLEIEGAKPDSALATTFERICDLLASEYPPYERPFLRVPIAIAAAANAPTFAFTADDDTLDFAALIVSGSYVRLGCRMEALDLVLDNGVLRVMPLESDDGGPMSELLRRLARIENVRVDEPTTAVGENRLIYYHPSTVWPSEWGNAEELLGFGTFDPFETFAEQFTPVFEGNPPKSAPAATTPRVEQVAPRPAATRDLGVLAAIAACFLWPVGIGLVLYHAAKNERRKAAQAAILCGAGVVLIVGLAPIQIGLGPAASQEYSDLIYTGFAVVAAAVAIALRSWLMRKP